MNHEVKPAPPTWLGRQLSDIRGALTGPPGQRAYDRKRLTFLVLLMVVVQLGAQGAGSVIRQQFQAQDKLLASLLDQARQEREQRERQHRELVGEMKAGRCETRAMADLVRVAILREKPPPAQECR